MKTIGMAFDLAFGSADYKITMRRAFVFYRPRRGTGKGQIESGQDHEQAEAFASHPGSFAK
jgi:hypothetical protein